MKLFRGPVKVYAADVTELAHLLGWISRNGYLSQIADTEFEVTAILDCPFSRETEAISGFYVSIPYSIAQKVLIPENIEQSFARVKLGEIS